MPTTSARALTLLSLLATGRPRTGAELAGRLEVSERTVRRDVEMLRSLGFPVAGTPGPTGRYQLRAGSTLPPLLFDDEQAVAVTLALQTAPVTVTGTGDGAARALATLRQVMPARLQPQVDALRVTAVPNAWDFGAPPVEQSVLAAVGDAVRRGHLLRVRLPGAGDPVLVEPHHLVVWAGRWYLVAHGPSGWWVHRVDALHVHGPTGLPFARRALPADDVAEYVMGRHDRGDTVGAWPCTGRVTMALPADVVARWVPAGAVVEALGDRCRVTLGAWSWAGVVGILATFDADLTDVAPAELRDAMAHTAARLSAAAQPGGSGEAEGGAGLAGDGLVEQLPVGADRDPG
ncbi:helix-turn-helix transcriptional regulator [Klenkia taihuensis]|uniref:Predicted DNA-binding transcriptional regulator YafY, contains an HTH and WYL domains n=1 Tax=Klenkia taihuensis TaxID=1225127 RepID=A0A1I1I3E1_9ACTN|nr:WYL domain-containing protein [Klenkia taihuensis]GHE08951.1 DeoR family transcriptional regulator [Klenkia taihuensis]SFC28738.1 Predicted DNA-binding transcriptional regulator YafY, contains an HTH and WYL domains [Klenkia taihuensis]